ncbi:MAG: MotA/TolQ/ExbB proton channel family protein [Myxococcales bacterium]|nr:MotA/TolQ/ExbB proton channel family protein [Myxococcales bacterium]
MALLHHYQEGGFMMHFILLCGLAIWAIAFERMFALYIAVRENKHALLSGIQKHILKGDVQAAIRFLGNQRQGPMARIIKAGLMKVNKTDKEVQAALDEASLREVPYIEKRTGHVAVLANVATLVGLLGTVIGMIGCFAGVANADPSQKAIILSKGISEAMNCTAFGLGNAVPGLLLYAMLQARTQHVIDGINESVVSTLNLVLANRQLFKNVNLEGTGTPAPAKARA